MMGPLELDNSSSFAESSRTESSSSTVWGPGALAGKLLKAIGEAGLDLMVAVIIRRRLAAMKQISRKNPHVLRSPSTPEEWQQMNAVYVDLKELCRERYSLSVRKEATRLIQDIELLTGPGLNISAGPTHSLWREICPFPGQSEISMRFGKRDGARIVDHTTKEDSEMTFARPWNTLYDDDGEIPFVPRYQLPVDPLSDDIDFVDPLSDDFDFADPLSDMYFMDTKINTQPSVSKATVGLYVTLAAKSDKGQAVSDFLVGGKGLVEAEPETIQWYGVKFSDVQHAMFRTFAAESGRKAHLNGKVTEALLANASTLLADGPTIDPVEILASMVRSEPSTDSEANVGLYVLLVAIPEKADAMKNFLSSALPFVEEEPHTLQWYAFRKSTTEFGIFQTAAGESGRNAHLNGKVATALRANAAEFLLTPPNIQKYDILASKVVV